MAGVPPPAAPVAQGVPAFRRNEQEQKHVAQQAKDMIHEYPEFSKQIRSFLESFEDPLWAEAASTTTEIREACGDKKYMIMLAEIANRRRSSLDISLADMEAQLGDLVHAIKRNTNRFLFLFRNEAVSLMPERTEAYREDEDLHQRKLDEWRTHVDTTNEVRAERAGGAQLDGNSGGPQLIRNLPEVAKKPFELFFTPGPHHKASSLPLREIGAHHVGSYVTVSAVVLRVGPVVPRVLLASYKCNTCGGELWQPVEGEHFTPLSQCPMPRCKTNKNQGCLIMQMKMSTFTKIQEVRIQELSSEVPVGTVPRGITLMLCGKLVKSCLPGDSVSVSGMFIPHDRSLMMFGRKMTESMYLYGHHVEKHKKGYDEHDSESESMSGLLEAVLQDPNAYSNLARSIAPAVHGHNDVKKALLLQLIGSPTLNLSDGLKIRGDLHILLMGDPGTAKSQMLKKVAAIAPRAIFTTGKGSSGVGLTAAIRRDPQSKEVSLEGGALVMADNGLCAIDEFDKMDDSDRTAIHEVMEQQTVSIAKAGLTTTLNARTAVLAAANPAYSRYNPDKSVLENMNLPAALLSRFDLQFVILDKPDGGDNDRELSKFVCNIHRTGELPSGEGLKDVYDANFMRSYIRKCRTFSPSIDSADQDLIGRVVEDYCGMRKEERESYAEDAYTTPRTLLAMLRLSRAHARMRCSEKVQLQDFKEARRLMEMSKASVLNKEVEPDQLEKAVQPTSEVWQAIKEICMESGGEFTPMSKIKETLLGRGVPQKSLDAALTFYNAIGQLHFDDDGGVLLMED